MTSPYSYQLADHIDPYVRAYKIGSGDITWIDYLQHVAAKHKPMLIATGAASFEDVMRAVEAVRPHTTGLCVMQCNTNYTGSSDNFRFVNLRVLQCYRVLFPDCVLGLSDHTPGHSAVLGAIALGATVVEKHFTDSNDRDGPDHRFSLTPSNWRSMVDSSRELESSLGDGFKRVEANEEATVVVQRRSLCASRDLPAGTTLAIGDLIPLRPCPPESFPPYDTHKLVGRTLRLSVRYGQCIRPDDLQ
jgi:N-acetylneuraminate synthase